MSSIRRSMCELEKATKMAALYKDLLTRDRECSQCERAEYGKSYRRWQKRVDALQCLIVTLRRRG